MPGGQIHRRGNFKRKANSKKTKNVVKSPKENIYGLRHIELLKNRINENSEINEDDLKIDLDACHKCDIDIEDNFSVNDSKNIYVILEDFKLSYNFKNEKKENLDDSEINIVKKNNEEIDESLKVSKDSEPKTLSSIGLATQKNVYSHVQNTKYIQNSEPNRPIISEHNQTRRPFVVEKSDCESSETEELRNMEQKRTSVSKSNKMKNSSRSKIHSLTTIHRKKNFETSKEKSEKSSFSDKKVEQNEILLKNSEKKIISDVIKNISPIEQLQEINENESNKSYLPEIPAKSIKSKCGNLLPSGDNSFNYASKHSMMTLTEKLHVGDVRYKLSNYKKDQSQIVYENDPDSYQIDESNENYKSQITFGARPSIHSFYNVMKLQSEKFGVEKYRTSHLNSESLTKSILSTTGKIPGLSTLEKLKQDKIHHPINENDLVKSIRRGKMNKNNLTKSSTCKRSSSCLDSQFEKMITFSKIPRIQLEKYHIESSCKVKEENEASSCKEIKESEMKLNKDFESNLSIDKMSKKVLTKSTETRSTPRPIKFQDMFDSVKSEDIKLKAKNNSDLSQLIYDKIKEHSKASIRNTSIGQNLNNNSFYTVEERKNLPYVSGNRIEFADNLGNIQLNTNSQSARMAKSFENTFVESGVSNQNNSYCFSDRPSLSADSTLAKRSKCFVM